MKDANSPNRSEEGIIKVVEEQISVHREVVETGKVHIHKSVKEEIATVNIPIINESYDIERRPGNSNLLDVAPSTRHEGDKMIIPILQEVSVVVKKYKVVEEIHLTRKVTETPMSQEITLRKEEVTIKRS